MSAVNGATISGQAASVPSSVSVLEPFAAARVFDPSEVQLAATIARLEPGVSDEAILALAVAARGPRLGHVCIELADVERLVVDRDDDQAEGLPWPDPSSWGAALAESPIVATPETQHLEPLRPLVWDGERLYLHRYWHHELAVADDLRARAGSVTDLGDQVALEATLDALFGSDDGATVEGPNLQRRAAEVALTHGMAVIVGGPGTGKTRTVARVLAAAKLLAAGQGRTLEVALAAPTGKAAARMTEAVRSAVAEAHADGLVSDDMAAELQDTEATTIHRLLGWAPGTRFRHDRQHPLPHDVVVVDETSMVALPLMARLLDAVRPDARLVLVGDPFQLASVEAGTVLGDVVGPALDHTGTDSEIAAAPPVPTPTDAPLARHVAVLRRVHRFDEGSAIAELAEAIRVGDADAALAVLGRGGTEATWVRDDDVAGLASLEQLIVDSGVTAATAALGGFASAGLEAASQVKVLAAIRHRPLGVYDWSDRIEAGVAARVPELQHHRRWYVGRPIMITANDPLNRVSNGDVGLVVSHGDGVGVAVPAGESVRLIPPSRLDRVDTWWAMTIHKSQGSEFAHAVVSLPPADSPILTRELLYTAVTRAREHVTVVGSEAAIRSAIDRPIARASGLRGRLWPTA